MFKRILKIVGLVLLGFVLLIGGVVGVMAIRGDFKKQVIKPTAISFTVPEMELTYDVSLTDNEVHSFTISAEPVDVTETECTIKLSNSSLITFVKWENGEWINYNSSKFYLNQPIYFKLNNITEENESDYYDGVLTITVKDSSGLLQTTLDMTIDRNITSISFVDQGNSDNNKIINGLFGYETQGNYDGESVQNLESIINQDYPLDVVTAPLKASKPFVGKDAKLYEIYYMEQEQPKLLTHVGENVKLQTYSDMGDVVEEDCEFLRYDTTANRYVFNSSSSGAYEFKLATYPTYAIQEEILSDESLSFIGRLNLGKMITKKVVITVNGTEAEEIAFEGDSNSIGMQLLKDNSWVVNNYTTLNSYNLGLVLSKTSSGTQILGRYNELKFLSSENYSSDINWTFKQAVLESGKVKKDSNGKVQYMTSEVGVRFYDDRLGGKKAVVSGITIEGVPSNQEYDAILKLASVDNENNIVNYVLNLTCVKYDDADNSQYITTTITFNLVADKLTGKVLSLSLDDNGLAQVNIVQQDQNKVQQSLTIMYLNLQVGSCFVVGDVISEENMTYNFKTLQSGLYLAILGKPSSTAKAHTLINDKFVTSIDYNGADSIITIKPIDSELINYVDKALYAIAVNTNGSWIYTQASRTIVVNSIDSTLNISDDTLSLPVIVGETIDYGTGFDVDTLVGISESGSYDKVLMFAPKYSLLTVKPIEWDNGLIVYTYNSATNSYDELSSKDTTFETAKYYTKNNYKTIDSISIKINVATNASEPREIEIDAYLLGYMENDRFVNKIVATGSNYYSKLYPVIVKSKYLTNDNRLQTAEEFVQELLSDKQGISNATLNGETVEITYDLSLLADRHIYKQSNIYLQTISNYSATKTYYAFNGTDYVQAEITNDTINNWVIEKANYYEKVDVIKAVNVLGNVTEQDTSNINQTLTYYTLENNVLQPNSYSIGSADFVSNWNNYYIIVSHYMIKSYEFVGENIKITANAVSKGIELTNISQEFTISIYDYNIDKDGDDGKDNKFKVDYAKIYTENVITATSYYDFGSSSITPTVILGGDYFDAEQTQTVGGYQIIAGHKDIELGWNGDMVNPINLKSTQLELTINSVSDADILKDIVSKLSVRAIEYNSSNQLVGVVSGGVTIDYASLQFGYKQASEVYDANKQYYLINGADYIKAVLDEETISNWSSNHTSYYVATIYVDFVVNNIISEGNYVKFEWVYTDGGNTYTMQSPKLTILSREVTGYTIDAGVDMYEASKIAQDTAPETYYAYDKVENKFVLVNETNVANYPYEKNKYYNLSSTQYNGAISYLLEVGCDGTDYTYVVYAVDASENRLYYMEGESENATYRAVRSDAESVALALKAEGGWINPTPFYAYASNAKFSIADNEYLKFATSEDGKYNITFAQITNNFVDLVIRSNNATIQHTIKVKVAQDGNFKYDATNIASSNSTKQYVVPENVYKYGDVAIDSKLDISIERFTVQRLGQNITSQYKSLGNKIVEASNEENAIAEIVFNGANWVINRSSFDNITITLKFTSLLKTETIDFAFTSPYEVSKSTTNKTNILYSGTTYLLAKLSGDLVEDDALYTLDANSSNGEFKIKYNDGKGEQEIVAQNGKFTLIVPEVEKLTNCVFTLYYLYDGNEERIGEFVLTIEPNVLITTNVNELIKLDDFGATEYDISGLGLSSYDTTKEYTTYTTDDLIKITDYSNINYRYETYIDKDFTTKYTTNIVKVVDNKLQVISPINKAGTYYVILSIFGGSVEVGEIKFEIVSKSQIVNANNAKVDDIEITANTTTSYTLQELQTMYNLQRNNEIYYVVTQYVEGITYKKVDDSYEKMTTDEGGVYYQKLHLTDILWVDYNNANLTITYKYDDGTTLQQIANKLIYGGTTYTLIGSNCNLGNYTFDISNNKFVDEDGKLINTVMYGDNIAYCINEQGERVICCKQNAYLFVDEQNANNILAISIDSTGKTIYNFNYKLSDAISWQGNYYTYDSAINKYTLVTNKVNTPYVANQYYVEDNQFKQLSNIATFELTYSGFGTNLSAGTKYVDNVEYSIEAVFNNNNISTNRVYNIYILPYKVNASTDVLLSSTSYVLYDNGNVADKGLFNINAEKYNNKVASISFGAGEDYEIQTSNYVEDDTQTKYTITFNAKGNNYVSYIPVTLTYSDGSTYSYNAQITVVNSSAVSINYPYNVEDTASASYSTFNASIEEFTKSINNQYDVNDLGAWLGYDVSVDNWTESARIKYDLALKGDIINLTEDKLLNVVRYNAYTYAHITNQAYEDGKYYKYNTSTNNFELVTGDEPSDWGSLNYFVKNVNTQSTIDKVELVAVSSTYASNVENVSESLALNGNTIAISESLDYTGYVLFKVYEKGTSAYGYYALKIVDDEQFDDVTVTAGRRTQTITKQLTSEQPIIEIIRNSGNDISSVAQIGSDLIDTNSTNVYLFMVDNYDNLGEKVLNNIANGKLIENTQVLTPNINIQTIVVAVVIQSGTSLVHVCNYNIVLQPDVDVKTGELIDTVIDGSYYIYKAKNLAYSYENISANTINLSEANYLEVTGTHGGELSSVKFDTSKTYTDVLSFDGNNVRIYNTSTQAYDVVATINGTNLKLIKAIGEINVSFYLELTYSSGFKAYLQITINKYDFNDTTTNFTVGNWNGTDNFENDFKLSTIFGNYTGEYNVEYSTNNGATWESSHSGVNHNTLDKILQFTPSNSEYKVRIKITLTSVVPNISKIIDITVKPNIVATYNQNVGNNPTATRVVPEVVGHTTQNQVGSILGVVITEKTIKIQNTTDATASPVTYMTINVGNFSSVKFSLTTDSGDELRIDENNLYSYFVMDGLQSSVDISDTSDLYFVHSAQDVNLRLNVTVANDNGNYAESYVLYITLPKTYTLSACYKVDGATYETVVNNQQLLLKADDEQSIDNNFFGTSETSVDKVYASRLAITDIYGNQYYGYDNIVALGLLTDGNPNKLNFELDAPSGTNVSSIDNGELTFRRDDNPPTVVLKMTNTTITTPIEYNFLVLTEDTDYSNIKYNEELLQVDSDNDGKLDYISVTFEQLENTTNPFELAYLKYLPNDEIAGQVGWVKTTNTNLTFKFESVTTTTDGYNSKIEVDSIGSLGSMMYNQITVTIITMNGVVGKIDLIVTNYSVSYAYNQASSNGYETAYGGTEIGKLTDNYNGTARVTATNIDDVFTSSNYSIEYVGAINGFESHWHFANGLDYSATNTSVVYYNDTKQSILSRSVADNTDVTMIFNVKYSGYVIGRIYYKLMLQNDIKIGLNPNLQSGNSATLYLGSNIYTLSGNETVIDLLQSESGANYNNVFITLEQYSTGNVIKDSNGNVVNKALYNGSNSILSASDVSSYLEFKISNPSQELVDKVRVDTNGKLYITGNPSGSFTLNVTSKNGTGYSESFIITVHQYDNTTAQYNNQINVGQGTGYVSDTQISLFTAKPNADDSGKYAFSSYRLGYGTSGNVTTSILDSDATVSFEVAVFDYGTSVKTIKESTAWESIAPNYIDNSYLYTLPSVKYSTGDSNEYQIVSIRLTVEYNGESKYYYAHYQVYNDINISVNKAYEGDKTITYGYNAWTNGSTITIMDTSNSGMYASVTPVLNVSDSEWANVYASCYTKNDNGTFTQLSGDKPTFENGKYYQLNDVVNNISDYTALIRLPDGTEKQITDLTVSGAKVTGTLPNALFTNQTEFTFILKSVETGASLLEDNWTIKANNTITAIDAMPLRTFFLTSEIGNQNYYNVDIIGIGASYNIFVTGGSYSKVSTVISSLGDGYSLKQVTYKGTSSGNSVFSVEATYYVLVGHSNAISLNSNSGQYYITLTVDDSNIVNNNATIDIAPYVKVWEYVGGFKQVTNASIGVGSSSSSSVTLSGISSYVNTDNPSKTITISGGTASREVEVYFNIMIKAKALNGGQMAYSAMLGNAMGDSTELTETDIDANLALKRELLSLITYNNKAIDVDDNTQISYFTISVSKYSDGYEIVYTYNNEATYTRTLYMALG